MVQLTGRYPKGKNKGRQWEVYADPASQTGYTRKEYDPHDTSNGGKPTEYFSPFNYSAAEADDEVASAAAAQQATRDAQRRAQQQDEDRKAAAFWQGVQQSNERNYHEGVRQFDVGQGYKDRELGVRARQGDRENDLRELDSRTRLKLGLRELELREQEGGAKDMRDRESNVLSYLTTIGKLRLPYTELQSLSQRAVAGIIPGGAAPAAAGAGAGGGGALTPDQWQALSTGIQRDYEQGQIGQTSALRG